MFTGIVEESGCVQSIAPEESAIRLVVRSRVCGRGLKAGGSLAVNGCCLTVAKTSGRGRERLLQFDLLAETWKCTNFRALRPGAAVNLERAVRAGGRMDGHFVTGHIDGVGKIIRWERSGRDHVLEISAPPGIMRYILVKGSVAVDGISLTVAAARAKSFRIWIIPHTLAVTALRERRTGDEVNLEADLLGKYVERFVATGC
ncbi:MAG: riboflavin synthase [Verrucomicrobiota bacterium]|jgi:riboflavin synthase